jgi:hypothetical protein
MKRLAALLLRSAILCFLALTLHGNTDAEVSIVKLADSKKSPGIPLSFEKPAGWSIEWYDGSDQSVARVYRIDAQGSEAMVISVSSIVTDFRGVAADKLFDSPQFMGIARSLNATIHKPDEGINWNGVYLDYALLPSVAITPYKINVRNWFIRSQEQLVQFQCYYVFNPALTNEQQWATHRRLEAVYRKILSSVKPTN